MPPSPSSSACRRSVAGEFLPAAEGPQVLQAETANKTTDKSQTRAIVTRPPGQHVSSKFIRREAARAADDEKHAGIIAERFAVLRTRVLREMRKNEWQRLAVVPVSKGAGGTFVAVNLAVAMARQKHTEVMLVDLDLGDPGIAGQLGIRGADPITEVLRQNRPLGDLVSIVEEAPNLSVLAPEAPEMDAAEILQDSAFADALKVLGGNYSAAIEVLDVAPLLDGDRALAALPLADAILLVADGRRGTAANMAEATRLLRDMPPIMGVVLNQSDD